MLEWGELKAPTKWPKTTPAAWANVQQHLAITLKSMGELEGGTDLLNQALVAVNSALEVDPDDESFRSTRKEIEELIASLGIGGAQLRRGPKTKADKERVAAAPSVSLACWKRKTEKK